MIIDITFDTDELEECLKKLKRLESLKAKEDVILSLIKDTHYKLKNISVYKFALIYECNHIMKYNYMTTSTKEIFIFITKNVLLDEIFEIYDTNSH